MQVKQTPQKPKNIKDGVDIFKMDTSIKPSETESSLEFLLNTMCRAFQIQPRQGAALMTNNNEYLTLVCCRGVKGNFEPVINWYLELFQYSRYFSKLIETEFQKASESNNEQSVNKQRNNLYKILQTLSCGLYSQNSDIAERALQLIVALRKDLGNDLDMA